MTNAILPENMRERTLADLAIGEAAWVPPWAMWVDSHRRCWLTLSHVGAEVQAGSVDLRVERRADGWVVDVGHTNHRWNPGGSPTNANPDGVVVEVKGWDW